MAYDIELLDITLRSSGDMSSNQYKVVAASSANAVGGCALVATRGAKAIGVFQDNSTAATGGKVRVAGVSKVLCGATSGMDTAIVEGGLIVGSSLGFGVPSTAADQHIIGQALGSLSTGVATAVLPVLLRPELST